MHIKRTLIIGTALAALHLSGCEALQEERQNFLDREEKITNVVGNVWRIEACAGGTSGTGSPSPVLCMRREPSAIRDNDRH